MTSNNVKMTGYQYITNTAPTTFQLAGSIAAGATVTYNIPLLLSFLMQLDFFLGNLNDLGLTFRSTQEVLASISLGLLGTSL